MGKPALDLPIFKPDFMLESGLKQRVNPVNTKCLTVFVQSDLEIEAWMKRIGMIANVALQRLPNIHRGKA